MSALQVWLRIVGTAFQVVGLIVAYVGLARTHRRYSEDHSGIAQSTASRLAKNAKELAERSWSYIRRIGPPQQPQYGPSLIGWTSATLSDPPASTRDLNPRDGVQEQLAALAQYAVEDDDSLRALERMRDRLADEIAETRRLLMEVADEREEKSRAELRAHALDGLSWAAFGLLITAAGTLAGAFS